MADAPPRRTLLTPGQEARFGLKVVAAVFAVIGLGVLAVFGGLLAAPGLFLVASPYVVGDGEPLDVRAAHRVVREHGDVLAQAVAWSRRSPLPRADSAACRSVVAGLGALDMRFEDHGQGNLVVITWSRVGLFETRETRLTWVPEASAEQVRAGRLRLGESFEFVDRGWWFVCR